MLRCAVADKKAVNKKHSPRNVIAELSECELLCQRLYELFPTVSLQLKVGHCVVIESANSCQDGYLNSNTNQSKFVLTYQEVD